MVSGGTVVVVAVAVIDDVVSDTAFLSLSLSLTHTHTHNVYLEIRMDYSDFAEGYGFESFGLDATGL